VIFGNTMPRQVG
jgi:hypothetical protein